MKRFDKIIRKLKSGGVPKVEFLILLAHQKGLLADPETEYETLKASGMPLIERDDIVQLSTSLTPIDEQTFTIVDIETNGSKPKSAQIIEIGAVKLQGKQAVDRFESFVHCKDVPDYITKITNISSHDLIFAPAMKDVLREFRLFLGDSVFVAHNVNFDYGFISAMMEKVGLGILANRRLCTIDLARRTIESERYGLEHLNTFLEIHTEVSHRAYADALTATEVLLKSLENLPPEIKTSEELIDFSKVKLRQKEAERSKRRRKEEEEKEA